MYSHATPNTPKPHNFAGVYTHPPTLICGVRLIKVFMPYLNLEYTKTATHTVVKVGGGINPATEFWVKFFPVHEDR